MPNLENTLFMKNMRMREKQVQQQKAERMAAFEQMTRGSEQVAGIKERAFREGQKDEKDKNKQAWDIARELRAREERTTQARLGREHQATMAETGRGFKREEGETQFGRTKEMWGLEAAHELAQENRRLGAAEQRQERDIGFREREAGLGRAHETREGAKERRFQSRERGEEREFRAGESALGREHQAEQRGAELVARQEEAEAGREFRGAEAEKERGFRSRMGRREHERTMERQELGHAQEMVRNAQQIEARSEAREKEMQWEDQRGATNWERQTKRDEALHKNNIEIEKLRAKLREKFEMRFGARGGAGGKSRQEQLLNVLYKASQTADKKLKGILAKRDMFGTFLDPKDAAKADEMLGELDHIRDSMYELIEMVHPNFAAPGEEQPRRDQRGQPGPADLPGAPKTGFNMEVEASRSGPAALESDEARKARIIDRAGVD